MTEIWPQRLTVSQLEERWRQLDAAPLGSTSLDLYISQIPPRKDICSELKWEFHLPDGDYFSARHHGYRVLEALARTHGGLCRGPIDGNTRDSS